MKSWTEGFDMLTKGDYAEAVVLAGGFRARMSMAELNSWTQYLRDRQEFMDYVIAETQLQGAINTNSDEISCLVLKVLRMKRALFEMAKEWCATNLHKDDDPSVEVPLELQPHGKLEQS
jgi:hypothetical protein